MPKSSLVVNATAQKSVFDALVTVISRIAIGMSVGIILGTIIQQGRLRSNRREYRLGVNRRVSPALAAQMLEERLPVNGIAVIVHLERVSFVGLGIFGMQTSVRSRSDSR